MRGHSVDNSDLYDMLFWVKLNKYKIENTILMNGREKNECKNFEFRLENFTVWWFEPKDSIGGKIFL